MKEVTIEAVDYDKIEAELGINIKREEGFSKHPVHVGLTIYGKYSEEDYFISYSALDWIKEK